MYSVTAYSCFFDTLGNYIDNRQLQSWMDFPRPMQVAYMWLILLKHYDFSISSLLLLIDSCYSQSSYNFYCYSQNVYCNSLLAWLYSFNTQQIQSYDNFVLNNYKYSNKLFYDYFSLFTVYFSMSKPFILLLGRMFFNTVVRESYQSCCYYYSYVVAIIMFMVGCCLCLVLFVFYCYSYYF